MNSLDISQYFLYIYEKWAEKSHKTQLDIIHFTFKLFVFETFLFSEQFLYFYYQYSTVAI